RRGGGAPPRRWATASIDRRIARTISGKPMIADASAAPVHRNAKTIPNHSLSRLPMGPRLPNSTSTANPTTTGGNTRGRWTIASTSDLPGKLKRANPYATTIASGRLKNKLTAGARRVGGRVHNTYG